MPVLFIEGERYVGKTQMLRKIIVENQLPVAGFFVQRLRKADGLVLGYELRGAESIKNPLEKTIFCKKNVFLEMENGKMKADLKVFETFAIDLLKNAQTASEETIILLDELGGMELRIPAFKEALWSILDCPKKVVGVYKSDQNFEPHRQNNQDGQQVAEIRKTLRQKILAQGQLLTLTAENQSAVYAELRAFLI